MVIHQQKLQKLDIPLSARNPVIKEENDEDEQLMKEFEKANGAISKETKYFID